MSPLPISCCPVAQKTTEQANIIANTAVAGANEVAQAAVDEVGNAAVASGLVSAVSDVMSHDLKVITFDFILILSSDFRLLFQKK